LATKNAAGASFPKSRHDSPTDLQVLRWEDGAIKLATVAGHATIPGHIQPLNDGFLLAGARCYWRTSGPETNGLACTWNGEVLANMTLGDGIEGLRTTAAGKIWVSYFDEGIFGNYGWSSPGPEPLGACGIVRFDSEGNIEFRYDARAAGTDYICDAYCMNVVSEHEVWTCFYTEFPIVQIKDENYRHWEYGHAGASAIAVHGQRVLLAGDYDIRNRFMVANLGADGHAHISDQGELLAVDGTALDRARFTGVGPHLYAIQDDVVYRLSDW
jgi:hypothetical protein